MGVWIETANCWNTEKPLQRHTLRGCVDWNSYKTEPPLTGYSHTLRGCVDWNLSWIQSACSSLLSHPSWVCGLKLITVEDAKLIIRHTLRGCVDWNRLHLFLLDGLFCHTLRGCVEWNRKQILFSEPTWKSHFYKNVPLIVNKLQWQKIWFGTSLSGLSLVLYRNL